MVTFAAATKNTSSFPTRARGQRRVGYFVAITCSVTCDSCDFASTRYSVKTEKAVELLRNASGISQDRIEFVNLKGAVHDSD